MKSGNIIHWYEGLFLQPHHFQLLQQSAGENINAAVKLFHNYPYGVISAELNEDALENFIVQFNEITVLMPGGIMISYPGNTILQPFNIKQYIQQNSKPVKVCIGLPIHTNAGSNTIERYDDSGAGDKRLYRVEEIEVRDENTGENPQIVQIRKYNARLVTDDYNTEDMILLPVLEVTPSSEEPLSAPPVISRKFISPSLTIGASRQLKIMISELFERCKSAREDIVAQLNRSGYNPELLSGTQLDKVLRLQIVNKYTGWLETALQCGITHPFHLYSEMRKMLGELAALQPARDLFAVSPYDHDNSYPVFTELFSRIRSLISTETSGSYIKVNFNKTSDTAGDTWIAELTEEHILKAEDYFVAIQFRGEPANIVNVIETGDQFKLMPASMVKDRIRGLKLKEERYPPSILPAIPNAIFFRLLRAESQRVWSRVRDEKKLAAVWTETNLPGMTVTLFITIFEEKV